MKFGENGLVGNSFRLTDTEYDENSFYGTSAMQTCCWESEGNIIATEVQYVGEYGYYYDVFDIWQTEIEGYDVLFLSKASYVFGAIKENSAIHLDISPNPISSNQNIRIHTSEDISIYTAQVYSAKGNLILKTDLNPHIHKYEINLGNTKAGVYILKIQTSKGIVVRKLIKK
ncbi:MAG: T9SS type A sorting domain-containing protein [Chlorobi bacterium]|nr:T9SS type A sorting domain-containing protein [Chlorobiota bacterium]